MSATVQFSATSPFYVNILSNHSRTLYVGMTKDLRKRIAQHKNSAGSEFTAKYKLNQLVWFEEHPSPISAIAREKQIKGWRRSKKAALIEGLNPAWDDLSGGVL